MHTSSLTFLVVAGVFVAVFGALAFWLGSRRGDNRKQVAFGVLFGVPGVYLCVCGSFEHIRVLSIVGVVLVVVSWVGQVVLIRRGGGRLSSTWKQPRGLPRGKDDAGLEKRRRYDEW